MGPATTEGGGRNGREASTMQTTTATTRSAATLSRPAAQDIAWPTAVSAAKAPAHDGAAEVRRSGLLRGGVGLVAGGILFALGHPLLAGIAATIGGLTAVLALVSPLGAYAALDGLMRKFGVLVGKIMTVLVMVPIFGLFFVPFGLLFRRGAKDPMHRALEPSAPSYWRVREDALGGDRHDAQY